MKIGIGADHNAFSAKEEMISHIKTLGHEVVDVGCYSSEETDYPGIAAEIADKVVEKNIDRGILICGTGIGMAITANKIKGVRAAQVHDPYSAERAQLSNNAQIITFGAKVIGIDVMKHLADIYLKHSFSEGRSARKIKQIDEIEKE